MSSAFRKRIQCTVLRVVRARDARVTLPVAMGAVGVAFWTIARSQNDNSQTERTVSVMTWNVLARPFTKHNKDSHRHTDSIEHSAQTRSRYAIAGMGITNQSSDLVFLQECEAAFFELEWNPSATSLLQMYDVYPCRRESVPGAAVLIKKRGQAVAKANSPICIGGTSETGGASKWAAVVPVRVGSKDILAASVHFTWDGAAEQRQYHAGLIEAQLGSQSCVVGGDFNCEPGVHLDRLESSSFLGKLRRAKLPADSMTGLNADFSKQVCIDHVYVSPDLDVRSATTLAAPSSPYAGKKTKPAKISGASDHVPLVVELAI